MQTLGADVANSTGLCILDWINGIPTVQSLAVRDVTSIVVEKETRTILNNQGWAAIDTGFGYPQHFSGIVSAMAGGGHWPNLTAPSHAGLAGSPWVRFTEKAVRDDLKHAVHVSIQKKYLGGPGSLVTQMITGIVATYASVRQSLLGAEVHDLVGLRSHVIEVYPAAALVLWGAKLNVKGNSARLAPYKDPVQRAARQAIYDLIKSGTGLICTTAEEAEFLRSGDALDALVCALLAYLVGTSGHATCPCAFHINDQVALGLVANEGWIHIPPSGVQLTYLRKLTGKAAHPACPFK